MSWFKKRPAPRPLSPFVQDVINLLRSDMDRWEIVKADRGYSDFALQGPLGIITVTRGSYEGFWYTVTVGTDEIELREHDWRAIEPAAQALYRHLLQPGIERKRQEREAANGRIAASLRGEQEPD